MVDSSDPLETLHDVHLPEPLSFWPPAWGWWILAAILLAAIPVGWSLWRRRKRGAIKRAALGELRHLQQAAQAHEKSETIAVGLSLLLRRVALACDERTAVAGLTGCAWLQYLDSWGDTTQFTGGVGQCLISVPYGDHGHQCDYSTLLAVVEKGIKGIPLKKWRVPS